jgi:ABC-type nickel/cobalt efflux system permease component RcnA
MSLAGIVLLGALLGMSHTLEADHLAAVASLATRAKSAADFVRMGIAWGLGHGLTLFLFGAVVLAVDAIVPEKLAFALELAAGVMLVLLGAGVCRRLVRRRVHFHSHRHEGGTTHFHAHAHETGTGRLAHAEEPHQHSHHTPVRALLVGVVHGLAGSAALVLLALEKAPSFAAGLGYIAVFGMGSTLGMAVLSAAMSVPFRITAARLTGLHRAIEGLVGVSTLLVGIFVVYRQFVILTPS